MIAVQPAVVERDYTPIASVWRSKLSVALLSTLIANNKNGVYFNFDNKDRLIVYRNNMGETLGATWDVVYQQYNKAVGNHLILNESKFSRMETAFEDFINRLNSKDPSKVTEKKAA